MHPFRICLSALAVAFFVSGCSRPEADSRPVVTLGPSCETEGSHAGIPALPSGDGILGIDEHVRNQTTAFVETYERRVENLGEIVETIGQTYEWDGIHALFRLRDSEGGEWLGFEGRNLVWKRDHNGDWSFGTPERHVLARTGAVSIAFAQAEIPPEAPGRFTVEFVGSELVEGRCVDHYRFLASGDMVRILTGIEQGRGDVWWEPELGYVHAVDAFFGNDRGGITFDYRVKGIDRPFDLVAYATEQIPDSAHLWSEG